jgi:hypothetical protein
MQITAAERQLGALSPERFHEALSSFKANGYVVLEGALDPSFVAELRQHFASALQNKISRFNLPAYSPTDDSWEKNDDVVIDYRLRPEGGNHDVAHWNMHLPSRRPFFDERVIANPLAIGLVKALLGEDTVLTLVGSDSRFPKCRYQTVHQDDGSGALELNIPLVDVNERNAPLEVWPGTHRSNPLDSSAGYSPEPFRFSDEEVRRYGKELPSTRVTIPAGSVLIRDQRMLHRGTPNRTDTPRYMLSLIYRRRPDSGVSHRFAFDMAARTSRFFREWGRGFGRGKVVQHLLLFGNSFGVRAETVSGTDRDYMRKIPDDLWRELSPTARQLLRYASIDGPERWTPEFLAERSLRKSLNLPTSFLALMMLPGYWRVTNKVALWAMNRRGKRP